MPWLSPARPRAGSWRSRTATSSRRGGPGPGRAAAGERPQLRGVLVRVAGRDVRQPVARRAPRRAPWPEQLLDDFRLLNAAITSRLMLEQSRRALAEAIDASARGPAGATSSSSARSGTSCVRRSRPSSATPRCCSTTPSTPPTTSVASVLRDGPRIVRACEQLLAIVDSLLGAGRALSSDDAPCRTSWSPTRWPTSCTGTARPAATAAVEMTRRRRPRPHRVGPRVGRTPGAGQPARQRDHPPRPGGGVGPPLGRAARRGERAPDGADHRARRRSRPRGRPAAHAFEPFVRFAAQGVKGTGLGLSISRTIAERDGGAVRGESSPGVGSTFWLELPEVASPAVPRAAEPIQAAPRPHVFSSRLGR